MTPHDVLTFWLGTDDLRAEPPAAAQARWFAGGDALDAAIAARFGAVLDAPERAEAWAIDPAGTLAAVIVLDQLPRNAFRGTARAFATDARALRLATDGIARGFDAATGIHQRAFLYLPFQHAEDIAAQERSVALYEALVADAVGTPGESLARGYLAYAEAHRDIVARFGRFPGRNPALGRPDTAEEAAWLAGGGETYGQRR
ncbi:MAG: DUF924 family protein [Myxococcota bacterium]